MQKVQFLLYFQKITQNTSPCLKIVMFPSMSKKYQNPPWGERRTCDLLLPSLDPREQ